jgi:hypothetical protein
MRAAFRRAGGIVVAAVLATGVLAGPAQAEPSSLSGTITSAATGEVLQGCASVYDLGYTLVASGCTDATGQWTAEGVETGVDYKVEVNPSDALYLPQWSGGAASFETASVVQAPTTVDTTLQYSRPVGDASLSGTVTADDTGEPLSACVTAYNAQQDFSANACAAEDGTWTIDHLEAGASFTVEFEMWDGIHLSEWAPDAATYEDAVPVTAPAVLDAGLAVGGTLEGTLTRADGQPAEWASVSVVSADDAQRADGWASTDETGRWSALVRPGEYLVSFDAWPASQWAFGQTSPETADHFTVAAGDTVRVDDQFLAAAKVEGTVLSDATHAGVDGSCVTVYSPSDDVDNLMWAGEGCADAAGHFSIDVGAAGTYIAEFTDPQGRYVSEFSGDTRVVGDAATFSVERGAPTTVDASLATGATMTGQAVDAKTGAVLGDVCPQAFVGHGGGYVRGAVPTCSGPDGQWAIKGLPSGSYALLFQQVVQDSAYSLTWAFKATSQATADLVSVVTGQTQKVRNVQLKPGGTISGRVTDYRGQPVVGAWVSPDSGYSGRAGGPVVPPYAQTDEDGRYTIHGVPEGRHTVFVEPQQWAGLAPLWSGNADTEAEAVPVRVKALKDTSYDAVLQAGAQITGSVVTADGQPTTDYWLGLIWTTSGEYIGDFDVYNGGNTFSSTYLPPGDFVLELTRYTEDGQGETVWYDSGSSREDATPVPLTRGEQQEVTIHLP